MIELFVKRPAMTVMLVLIFVVLGVVSYLTLPIELVPKVSFPVVTVKAIYPGASPAEIETQIVKKVEDAVSEISEIKRIRSEAYDNFGYTMIEFNIEADANLKAVEVKDKVEAITNDLPLQAKKPEVSKYDPLVMPVLDLILTSQTMDERALYEYADKTLRNTLTVIEGVASVDIFGGRHRQINVKIDPQLTKKFFLAIDDVLTTIQNRNITVPGGSYDQGDQKIAVRTLGEFQTVDDLAKMKLVSKDGVTLMLSDIATVEDGFRKIESYSRFNQITSVGLSVKKLSDGNAVEVSRRIHERLASIRAALPSGTQLDVAFDSTKYIVDSTNSTVQNILYGIALTVLILLAFLGSVRSTLVSAIVIPTSIVSAFFLMDFSGCTINMITLLAIATALGTLIANALVIIESIDAHLKMGKSSVQAAIDGTREVTVAVLASAGTNLVVFTPIAFMKDIVGQFMRQMGLTVIYTTIFSILASFTLTPMLCALLMHRRDNVSTYKTPISRTFHRWLGHADRGLSFLISEYRIVFDWTFQHPKLTLLMTLLAFAAMVYPMRYLGSEFFPPADQDKIVVRLTLPPGTNVEHTLSIVKELEVILTPLPETKSILSYTGKDDPTKASITVNLLPLSTRKRTDAQIINALIPKAATIPDAEIAFSRGSNEEDVTGADVDIDVYGVDQAELIRLSNDIKAIMVKSGFFRSVESSFKGFREEIRFTPDEAKLTEAGVKYPDIAGIIRSSINGDDTNLFKERAEEYKINVELADAYKQSLSDIRQLDVMSKEGLIKIAELGTIASVQVPPSIMRRDKQRIIQLSGFLQKSTAGVVRRVLDKELTKVSLPPGYGYRHVGQAEFQADSEREISKAFILAVILTYMLLVALLNSFLQPLVIATTIATSFIGVFLILFFMDFSVNIASMMSMVMVVGIVVNNAILILDYTAQKMREGIPLREALWKGAEVKFRAVLMTSLAVVMGALPQLFDPDGGKAAMGAVIIGGLLASIVFTLLLIPLTFWYSERLKAWLLRKLPAGF